MAAERAGLRSGPGRLPLALAFSSALLAGACDSKEPPPAPVLEVVVTPVVQQDVPVRGEWVGTTEGYINAQIRPQVTGYLLERHYREGSVVKEGDLLFEIDPRQFRAVLDQARGALGEAQAMLGKARLDVERYTPLAAEGAVSQQELDDAVQAKLRAEASVLKARAEVEQARLNLEWTKITSPIAGVSGIAQAQVGDLVAPDTVLTTVSQLDPIKVAFPISEQEYLNFRRHFRNREQPTGKAQLELILADGTTYEHRGALEVVGREVDARTGTIQMEGYFENSDNFLRPGQFAKVRAVIREEKGALLVPQRAVGEAQGTYQVAVVGPDSKVSVRAVEMGQRSGELWVVREGVKAGEQVIVEGIQKVRNGMTVKPVTAKAAAKGKGGNAPAPRTSDAAASPTPGPTPAASDS